MPQFNLMLLLLTILMSLHATCMTSAAAGKRLLQVSQDLTYNLEKLDNTVRVQNRYSEPIAGLQLVYSAKSGSSQNNFRLEIQLRQSLLQMGNLRSTGNYPSKSGNSLHFTPIPGGTATYSISGSVTQLNEFLSTLEYYRDYNTSELITSDIRFFIRTESSGSSGASDSFTQQIQLPPKIELAQVTKGPTIYLEPGKAFTAQLVRVKESKQVALKQSVRLSSESSPEGFYYIRVLDEVVTIQGKSPLKFATNQSGRAAAIIKFSLHDDASSSDSETFTYWLEIDPALQEQSEQIKVLFLSAIIIMLLCMLFICLYLVVRKDKKQQKEAVQQVVQEIPQENILTKSILDWNKETTTTRDQTGKDSVVYNPYNQKYALKKKPKDLRKQEYTLMGRNANKLEHSQDQSSDVVSGKTKNESESGEQQFTAPDDISSGRKVQKPVFSTDNVSSPRLPKNSPPKSDKREENYQNHNMSQLEFSKVEEFNSNVDRKLKDDYFGDMSQIKQSEAIEAETKRDQELDVIDEDIILKNI